jgi:hypothetical protein
MDFFQAAAAGTGYYRTNARAEVDLIIEHAIQRILTIVSTPGPRLFFP